jgi:hypothetical protein
MSLGRALRASGVVSSAGSDDSPGSGERRSTSLLSSSLSAAAAAAATTPAPTKLHFFPLPRAPVWRRLALSGGVVPPPTAAHTLTLLNHGRTLLMYGGTTAAPTPGGAGGAGAQAKPEFYILDSSVRSVGGCGGEGLCRAYNLLVTPHVSGTRARAHPTRHSLYAHTL